MSKVRLLVKYKLKCMNIDLHDDSYLNAICILTLGRDTAAYGSLGEGVPGERWT